MIAVVVQVGGTAPSPASRPPRAFPSRAVDMTGQRLGRLLILRRVGRTDHGHAIWECRCDCGALHRVSRRSLLHPASPTRSCGCLHAELSRARAAALAAARQAAIPIPGSAIPALGDPRRGGDGALT